jgi:biopolymer transport protein TolR
VTVQADRTIYLQETKITLADLTEKLKAVAKAGNDEQIMVRADTSVNYGAVMEVMGLLNAAGYKKIGLVTGNIDKKAGTAN